MRRPYLIGRCVHKPQILNPDPTPWTMQELVSLEKFADVCVRVSPDLGFRR